MFPKTCVEFRDYKYIPQTKKESLRVQILLVEMNQPFTVIYNGAASKKDLIKVHLMKS